MEVEADTQTVGIGLVKRVSCAVLALVIVPLIVSCGSEGGAPGPTRPDDIGSMVNIPAGPCVRPDGSETNLASFYIDKYEVTLGQYREFLRAYESGAEFQSHPFTPRRGAYYPFNWRKIVGAVEQGVRVDGARLTWDSPVFGLTWFDAFAYASWRGKRLPTILEWEQAARGFEGYLYPWGDEFDPAKCNCVGRAKGRPWAPVFAFPGDSSPFGVIHMGGNVREWTATCPDRRQAVVCGGSWEDDRPASTNWWVHPREYRAVNLGFRCAADQPPVKK